MQALAHFVAGHLILNMYMIQSLDDQGVCVSSINVMSGLVMNLNPGDYVFPECYWLNKRFIF